MNTQKPKMARKRVVGSSRQPATPACLGYKWSSSVQCSLECRRWWIPSEPKPCWSGHFLSKSSHIFPYLSMDHDGYRWDAMVYKWHKLLHPPMFWSTVLNRSLPALWCEIWCRQVSHNYEQGQQLLQSREFSTRRRQKPTAVFRFFWGISWRIFQEFMGFSWDFQANVRVWPWDGWFFLDFVKIHYSKMLVKDMLF